MPFQDTAESLAAKLHLGKAGKAVCIGCAVLMLMAAAFAGKLAFEAAAANPSIEVERASSASHADGKTADQAPAQTPGIVVYVTGEVESPGVYELGRDARVNDAIAAAGGFTDSADRGSCNLARTLADGEQITVVALPEEGDEGSTAANAAAGASASGAVVGGLVNINRATEEDLQTISGIGPSTAAKIVADREKNGPYATVQDLMRVSGIGEKRFANIEPYITV